MRILTIVSGVLIVLGCTIAYSGATPEDSAVDPVMVQQTAQPTAPLPSELPTSIVPGGAAQPGLPERRRITLEFPPEMRAGDSEIVRLTLEVDDLGNITPTAQIGGNTVTGELVEIPNLYESHHVIAEARFDIAGMEVRPTELVSQPLAQASSATFYWSMRPEDTGTYRGTIWLHLLFVDKQTGDESRKTISAQIVEIEAVNMLGFSGTLARATGAIGSVVGTIIGFPFFEDAIKFLLKRKNKQNL